jgi:hypothetical protein
MNHAPTRAAGCYQRNRTTPDAEIATAAMADRRVPLVHQHTNSITSHEAAIHSEDQTRDPAGARARKGEGGVPQLSLYSSPKKCRIAKLNCQGSFRKAK